MEGNVPTNFGWRMVSGKCRFRTSCAHIWKNCCRLIWDGWLHKNVSWQTTQIPCIKVRTRVAVKFVKKTRKNFWLAGSVKWPRTACSLEVFKISNIAPRIYVLLQFLNLCALMLQKLQSLFGFFSPESSATNWRTCPAPRARSCDHTFDSFSPRDHPLSDLRIFQREVVHRGSDRVLRIPLVQSLSFRVFLGSGLCSHGRTRYALTSAWNRWLIHCGLALSQFILQFVFLCVERERESPNKLLEVIPL